MAKTIGSFDLASLKNLRDDVTQYFWFESNSSSAWGSGAHVTLYPESQFTNPNHANYMKGQNIIMNTDGFSIRNGGLPMMVLDNDSLDFNVVDITNQTYTNVASFGSVSTIGVTDGTESYMYLDFHSLQLRDKEGNTYFYVSDLRNKDGTYTETFTGNGTKREFDLRFASATPANEVVTIDDIIVTAGYRFTPPYTIYFDDAPQDSAIIKITYDLEQGETVKAYTIGKRGSNKFYGRFSLAEGYESNATGDYSHAEGYQVLSGGYCSHAEGYLTKTHASSSHAEGYKTKTYGSYSHAEGYYSTAHGDCSHAQNRNTKASSDSQTALGKYNIEDDTDTYAVIIGNGTADNARSNAFTVDWNGNVETAGEVHGTLSNPTISITASTGTLQSATVYKQGNVVQLLVSVQKTTATASGQDVFKGTINTTALRPKMTMTGGTYYGSYALNAAISPAGTITIRNSDSRQLAAMTSYANVSFAYLVD